MIDTYLVAAWNRPLKDWEAVSLSRNPWQIFWRAHVGRRINVRTSSQRKRRMAFVWVKGTL